MVRDYESDEFREVLKRPRPKTVIARAVKGNYPDALSTINRLIEKGFLEIKDGIVIFKPNDITQDHEHFQFSLKEFKEAFSTYLIPELKKIRKKTKEPLFYVTIEKNGAQMFHINKQARDMIISLIMAVINNLIRSSFTLYQKQVLGLVPKPYERMINEDVKLCAITVKETKERLAKMVTPKNRPAFEDYWYLMTAGLRVNF